MARAHDIAVAFVDTYAEALLARNGEKIARLYAVPALIAFPHQCIAVSDREQTRQFFDQGWDQYTGVDEVESAVTVIASTSHSIWADVVWSYGGQPRERFIYQLLGTGDDNLHDWRIGVLTPLGLDD